MLRISSYTALLIHSCSGLRNADNGTQVATSTLVQSVMGMSTCKPCLLMLLCFGVSYFCTVTATPPLLFDNGLTVCTIPLPKVFCPTSVALPFSFNAAANTSAADAVFPSTNITNGSSRAIPGPSVCCASTIPKKVIGFCV